MKSIKSIGIEIELFLRKKAQFPNDHRLIEIHNAERVMEEKLGFSIDGKNYTSDAKVVSGRGINITTDGTPIEFSGFISSLLSDQEFNRTSRLNCLLSAFKATIESTRNSLLKEFDDFCFNHCYADNSRNILVNPGQRFSSFKTIYNAYTGETREQEKKDGGEVTSRTAGLHIHFEFSKPLSEIPFEKMCQIIRALDDIYKSYYHDNPIIWGQIKEREKYQKFGDFRAKKQRNGVETLEYRQLTPNIFGDGLLIPFICHADHIISQII